MSNNSLTEVQRLIRHLEEQGAAEATNVASLLDDLVLEDNPDLSIAFLVASLGELIGWAQHAQTALAPLADT